MPKILNLFFSSRKDHAAVNYLHSELSCYLTSRGYDVTGLCLSGKAKDWSDHIPAPTCFWEYERRVVKRKQLWGYFCLQWRLTRFIKVERFDAILCDGLGVLNLLARLRGIDLPPVITVQHAPPRPSDKLDAHLARLLVHDKHTLVAISPMVRERLCVMGFGDANRIKVIPNAIDFPMIRNQQLTKAQARAVFGLRDGEFVVGTIGRLVGYKQHQILIEALAVMQKQSRLPSNWRFLLVGDGPELDNLKTCTQVNQLEHCIVFAGAVENASRYVKALDLFVMTSNEDEGFGLVILEAIAGNVPVIANDTPVFRELVADEQCRFSLNSVESLAEWLLAFSGMTGEERDLIAKRQAARALGMFNIDRFHEDYESLILEKIAS